jgi:hypothetical protein
MHRDPAASSGFRVSGSSAFALSRDKANANHAHDAITRGVSGDPLPSDLSREEGFEAEGEAAS